MKKGDVIWSLVIALIVLFLVYPTTHKIFVDYTIHHPYISGFIKFSVLASMGELLASRIVSSDWKVPSAMIYRSIIWGFLGMAIVLTFDLFASSVAAAMEKGMLPGGNSKFLFAFFVSSVMNLTFGPTMMAFHRITDTFLDMKYSGIHNISIEDIVSNIDWNSFYSFVIVKTIPLFWIPAHTITFLLKPEYRIIVAASLSIALGAILSFAKKNTQTKEAK